MSVSASGRSTSFDPMGAAASNGVPGASAPEGAKKKGKKEPSSDSGVGSSPSSRSKTSYEGPSSSETTGSSSAPSLREIDPNILKDIPKERQVVGPGNKVVGVVDEKGQVLGADGSVLGVVKDGQIVPANASGSSSSGSSSSGSSSGSGSPGGQPLKEIDPKILKDIPKERQVVGPGNKVVGVVDEKGQVLGADGSVLGVVKDGQIVPASGASQGKQGADVTGDAPSGDGDAGQTTALTGEQLLQAIITIASSPQMQELVSSVVDAAINEALASAGQPTDPTATNSTSTGTGTNSTTVGPTADPSGSGLPPDAINTQAQGSANGIDAAINAAMTNTNGSAAVTPNTTGVMPSPAVNSTSSGMNDAALNSALANAGYSGAPGTSAPAPSQPGTQPIT